MSIYCSETAGEVPLFCKKPVSKTCQNFWPILGFWGAAEGRKMKIFKNATYEF